MSATVGE